MKNTFTQHLSNARKEKLIEAWQYLKPHQKLWLYLRAIWWSLPPILGMVELIQLHFNTWLTYRLYHAHWLRNYRKE